MVYGYIRVSSDKQTVENQRFEINKFCEKLSVAQRTTQNANLEGFFAKSIRMTLLSVVSCHVWAGIFL